MPNRKFAINQRLSQIEKNFLLGNIPSTRRVKLTHQKNASGLLKNVHDDTFNRFNSFEIVQSFLKK